MRPGACWLSAALLWLAPADAAQVTVPWTVHASTRNVLVVTQVSRTDGSPSVLVGTEGGLVVISRGISRHLLPGVPVRALAPLPDRPGETLVGADTGLYLICSRGLLRLSSEPTTALHTAGREWYTGHPEGVVCIWDSSWQPPEGVPEATTAPAPSGILRLGGPSPVLWLALHRGSLFCATWDALWVSDRTGLHRQTLSPDPLAAHICTLASVGGRVMVGTPVGLFAWAAGEWARVSSGPGSRPYATALAATQEADAWVADDTEGLFRLHQGTLIPLRDASAEITAIREVDPRTLLIGTAGNGAWRWRLTEDGSGVAAREPLTDHQRELPENGATSLAWAPHSRTLYAGTSTHGVGAFRQGAWSCLDRSRGLPDDWINQVASDGSRLYVRDSRGQVLTTTTSGAWRKVGKRPDGWPKDWTSALGFDGGRLWAGTLSAFYLLGPGGWQVFAPKPQLQGKMVTDLAFRGDEIWIATHKHGLLCWNLRTGAWQHYALAEGFPDTWVTAVEVLGGEVWAGTFSKGLARLAESGGKRTWTVFVPGMAGEPLPSERVNCLKAAGGRLFVGTLGGLTATDGTAWRTWGLAEGLPCDSVRALEYDGADLWVGTDGGLLQAPLAALDFH